MDLRRYLGKWKGVVLGAYHGRKFGALMIPGLGFIKGRLCYNLQPPQFIERQIFLNTLCITLPSVLSYFSSCTLDLTPLSSPSDLIK
jgi:hypothetical protein